MFRYIFKICFLFIIWGNLIFSQQVSFRQLSVKDGLSQNSVISIAQDSIGFLWFATQDGLNKYNGKDFEKYNLVFSDITNNSFYRLGKVYVDLQQRVWAITIDENLMLYDNNTNKFNRFGNYTNVSFVFQDSNLNLWIGTFTNGLFCIPKNSSTPIKLINNKKIGAINFIKEDYKKQLWITSKGKVFKINIEDFDTEIFYPDKKLNSELNFSTVEVLKDNILLFGTLGEGIYIKNSEDNFSKNSAFKLPDSLSVYSILNDSKGRIWIGTYGDGLYKINTDKKVSHYTTELKNPRSLHYNDVLSAYEDITGTIWFGTDGGGVSFYDEYLNKFNFITNNLVPDGISVEVIRAITENEKNIWIGTSGKGLTCFNKDEKSWKTYLNSNSGLLSNRIMSLLQTKEGIVIGTQDRGLFLLKNNIIEPLKNSYENSIISSVWAIKQDKNDNLWLATRDNGLVKYNIKDGVLKHFSENNSKSFPVKNVRSLEFENDEIIWIGTESKGVFKFNSSTGSFNQPAFLKIYSQIKSLFFDKKTHLLWIGTNGKGLIAYNTLTNKQKEYTIADGLANNVIYGILQDEKGNLWLSSNKGIIEFYPEVDFNKQPKIVNYNNYDGLATEFNTGAYFKSKSGTLYFGGLDGFYWFDPKNISENSNLPKTFINQIEIFDEKIPFSNQLKLKSNQNTISFTFSSIQYSLPDKNQYQYKLVGYDQDWIFSENRNFARYSKLVPGKYEFLVKSSNYDGIWNNTPAKFQFEILKPWYFSNIAIIIYFLLFLLLLYYILKYFEWKWKMELELKFEKEEAYRFKELNDYKSKLYSNISHEFRTPLTLINSLVITQLEGENSTDSKNKLNSIQRNTNRLIHLVDQMLELTKLDSGTLKLNEEAISIGYFLQMIIDNYKPFLNQDNLQLKATILKNKKIISDGDLLEKILNNLLSNAIKYAEPNSTIIFNSFIDTNQNLNIEIINNIREIPNGDVNKLFERFYRASNNKEGTGIGLSLIKELTNLLKGKIEAKYLENNTKIKFTVCLPISYSEIKEIEEINTVDEVINNKKNIVLVVEDNAEIRNHLVSLLKQDYKVLIAKNGEEGIAKALEIIPDIIVTDIIMPKKTGIELCDFLKNTELTSHIPIVLLTAKSDNNFETKGLRSGADEYLTKPFNPTIFKLKLKNILGARNKIQQKYSSGNILKLKEIAYTSIDEKFISRVQEILDQYLCDSNFTAEKFSEMLGMSRMQLHRKLNAITGHSTTSFIRSERLKLAVKLLDKSGITVSEVAYATGFNTPSYFIKCYKEVFGTTPKQSENQ